MEHTLEIKKIIHGGSGLGYLQDGLVTMVPFVLPGETVVIREKKRSKKFLTADLVQVLSSAPERQPPPCPYYTRCGGCNLQHIKYKAQTRLKRQLLQEALERSKVDLTGITVNDTLASPHPFHYRHRIRLHLDKKQNLGFHRMESNQVIPVERCLLATDSINTALNTFCTNKLSAELARQCKAVEFVASPDTQEIITVLHPRNLNNPDPLLSLLESHTVLKTRAATTPKAGRAEANMLQTFTVPTGTYQLSWDHNCFFQTNPQQNQQLVALLCSILQDIQPGKMLDLFCGIGNFSLPAALMGWEVVGVEHNHHSIRWAKHNSQPVTNMASYICRPVAEALEQFVNNNKHVDLVLVDPPRQGLDKKAVQAISKLAPQKMIYISCDPATLGRDLNLLISNGFYLNSVTPVDMFPQTHHIESAVVLEKN